MLGFIGFSIAAIIISLFAISFYASFKTLALRQRQLFSAAFLLLGAALFIWGLAPLINLPSSIAPIIFYGDVLLVIGSGLLIAAQFKVARLWVMVILALSGAMLLTLRAFVYEPAAFVQDGLLHFNLEGTPRYVIIAILAFVWMPLGTRVTQMAVRSRNLPQFGGAIALIYTVSLLCAAVFIAARQNTVVIASFAALAFTFLILAFIPFLINRYSKAMLIKPHQVKKGVRNHGK